MLIFTKLVGSRGSLYSKASSLSLTFALLTACSLEDGVEEIEDVGTLGSDSSVDLVLGDETRCDLGCWLDSSSEGCCEGASPRCAPHSSLGSTCMVEGTLALGDACYPNQSETCRSEALCVYPSEESSAECFRRCIVDQEGAEGCEPRDWMCQVAADCPEGYICDLEQGCQPRRFCASDEVCPMGQICERESSLCQSLLTCRSLELHAQLALGVCTP